MPLTGQSGGAIILSSSAGKRLASKGDLPGEEVSWGAQGEEDSEEARDSEEVRRLLRLGLNRRSEVMAWGASPQLGPQVFLACTSREKARPISDREGSSPLQPAEEDRSGHEDEDDPQDEGRLRPGEPLQRGLARVWTASAASIGKSNRLTHPRTRISLLLPQLSL